MLLCRRRSAGLLLTYSSSLPKSDETAELSHISNSECLSFFLFFLFSVCAQSNTSSFSRLYCLVSSHSLWDEFGGRTRELCSPGTGRSSLLAMILISLAHEHSDSRKSKIPQPMCSYYCYVHQSYTNTCMLITVFWLVFSMAHSCLAIKLNIFWGLSA